MKTRWQQGAAALFASAALASGILVLSGSPAAAEKAKVPCYWQGEQYPHGSVIQDRSGNFWTCYNGNWVGDPQ